VCNASSAGTVTHWLVAAVKAATGAAAQVAAKQAEELSALACYAPAAAAQLARLCRKAACGAMEPNDKLGCNCVSARFCLQHQVLIYFMLLRQLPLLASLLVYLLCPKPAQPSHAV
jgi:hypothetical protein